MSTRTWWWTTVKHLVLALKNNSIPKPLVPHHRFAINFNVHIFSRSGTGGSPWAMAMAWFQLAQRAAGLGRIVLLQKPWLWRDTWQRFRMVLFRSWWFQVEKRWWTSIRNWRMPWNSISLIGGGHIGRSDVLTKLSNDRWWVYLLAQMLARECSCFPRSIPLHTAWG